MRLTQPQIQSLQTALNPFLEKTGSTLYLYGSRVLDHAKGGDIDLLLVLENSVTSEKLKEEKHRLLANIKKINRRSKN